MKAILKEKYRYIAFKIESKKKIDKKEFEKHLQKALILLVGEIDYPSMMPKLVHYKGNTGIIRILKDSAEKAKLAMSMITKLNGADVHLQSVFTSGTLSACKRAVGIRS